MRPLHCWICLSPLLFAVVLVDGNIWTRNPGQNFELSSCLFSNGSDYQLNYYCYDGQGIVETSRKPNTFKVTERLCDDEILQECSNVTLFFFLSQRYGLCIFSDTTTLLHESIGLLYYTSYTEYLTICVEFHDSFHRGNYSGKFSCTKLLDQTRMITFTIEGYDMLAGNTWKTRLKLKIVHSCDISLDQEQEAIPVNSDNSNQQLILVSLGILTLLTSLCIFSALLKILWRCFKARKKQYEHETFTLNDTQPHLITNFQQADLEEATADLEEATIVANCRNSMVYTFSTVTWSDPQKTNTNSSISLPDTISTCSDPQQATANAIPVLYVDIASIGSYPQVNDNSSVTLPDTISTGSQPQQADTTSPSDSGSSDHQFCTTSDTDLIPSIPQQDNSSQDTFIIPFTL